MTPLERVDPIMAEDLRERVRRVEERLAVLESALDIIAAHLLSMAQGEPPILYTRNGDG